LRPQDLLMLEVATTSELAPDVPERSSTEYLRSRAFCEFVTSALHQHTDLSINMDYVDISGEIMEPRSVMIKVIYHHRDKDTRVTLPDRTVITLRRDDTIRLYLTRKYATASLHDELRSIGLAVKETADATWAVRGKPYRFGLQLLLLAKGGDTGSGRSAARDLFRNG
jgi:L-histidine N-alpha-methyltransferase